MNKLLSCDCSIYVARLWCVKVVSTSEHHAEGMGSNPTPIKLFSFSSARGRIYLLEPRFRKLANSTGKRFQIGQQMKFSKYSKKILRCVDRAQHHISSSYTFSNLITFESSKFGAFFDRTKVIQVSQFFIKIKIKNVNVRSLML